MAEVSAQSTAKVAGPDASNNSSVTADSKPHTRPERPNEEQYKLDLEKAKKELAEAQEATKAAQAKVNLARPGNKESPTSQRQQELRAKLSSIKQKQQDLKASRTSVQDKIKLLDGQLKARINDQKQARSKVSFKSVDEIDREIQRLEKQVDSGTMKLVDEKKTLADITALRKQRKAFTGFDETQKSIDDLKAQIADLKKGADDPESKSLSDEFAAAAKELDEIKAEQDGAFKNLNASRDELTKARAHQDQKYTAVKAIQDKYYHDKRAYHDYEREATRQRQLRRKAENDAYWKEKRRAKARAMLEEAAVPAYGDEIRSARNILQRLDPAYVLSTSASDSGKLAATAQRTVQPGNIQGTRLAKKGEEEETYFQGTGGKKSKKVKKVTGDTTSSNASSNSRVDLGFFMSPGVLQEMNMLELEVPSTQEEIPVVTEKLKEKLKFYEADQDRKTKENIANAQKEIDKLEAEAQASSEAGAVQTSRKAAAAEPINNGDASNDTSVADAADKLAGTSIDEVSHDQTSESAPADASAAP